MDDSVLSFNFFHTLLTGMIRNIQFMGLRELVWPITWRIRIIENLLRTLFLLLTMPVSFFNYIYY